MKWRKLGRVYAPGEDVWWARAYALLPTVAMVDPSVARVYFATMDDRRFGRITFLDVDARNPARIVGPMTKVALDLGELGAFDDSGVNPSCVVDVDGTSHLFYTGWQRAARVPYLLFAGAAARQPDGSFRRVSRTPVFDRTADEPFLRSAPAVLPADGGGYLAWYVSGVEWTNVSARQVPAYVIRCARSADALSWTTLPGVCVGPQSADEYGFGRPWVVKDPSGFRMWYAIRSRTQPYRIGYAESDDGVVWTRRDAEAGIERSDSGWDSEMICYPCVVDLCGQPHMFYNGNQHGRTGFGVAVLEG